MIASLRLTPGTKKKIKQSRRGGAGDNALLAPHGRMITCMQCHSRAVTERTVLGLDYDYGREALDLEYGHKLEVDISKIEHIRDFK